MSFYGLIANVKGSASAAIPFHFSKFLPQRDLAGCFFDFQNLTFIKCCPQADKYFYTRILVAFNYEFEKTIFKEYAVGRVSRDSI